MKDFFKWPITELVVNVLVLMAILSFAKLALNTLPDNGIVGDAKHFFMLA